MSNGIFSRTRSESTFRQTQPKLVEAGQNPFGGPPREKIANVNLHKRRLLSQNGEETYQRLDAAIKIRNVKFLVRRVQIVIGQSETHHHARESEVILELGDDGDRAAGAYVDRLLVENLTQGLVSRPHEVIIGANDRRRAPCCAP